MPYSLKVKLGHLNYKGILTEQEYIRLINALDHEKILTVTDFADRCRECGARYGRLLKQIRAEIDRQQKWLLQAGYTAYNADIAFDAIKAVVAESEDKE